MYLEETLITVLFQFYWFLKFVEFHYFFLVVDLSGSLIRGVAPLIAPFPILGTPIFTAQLFAVNFLVIPGVALHVMKHSAY